MEETRRKLASIQKIVKIDPIYGCDNICLATVLGWKVIVRKNEFQVNDLCVYFEPDSLIPRYEWSKFLFKNDTDDYVRLRVRKVRGVVSYGIVFKYEDVFGVAQERKYIEGDDITETLAIKKWEDGSDSPGIRGKIKGGFPNFVPRTDELRAQGIPKVIDRHRDVPFYVSIKINGSSATYYLKDGEFGICSRNNRYAEDDNCIFAEIARSYNIKEKLLNYGRNIAIQGEALGPKVQKNIYRFGKPTVFFFNVWDINEQKYLDYADFVKTIKELGLETVPILTDNFTIGNRTIDDLVEMAKGEDTFAKVPREGLVFRPLVEMIDYDIGRLSFKCINSEHSLKYE